MRWQPRDRALLRYVENGSVAGAIPVTVVQDSPQVVALWLADGTPIMWPYVDGRPIREVSLEERFTLPWRPGERAWEGAGVLIVNRPARAHSLWLFWADEPRTFEGWYVQLEEPYQRTPLGFDTRDHTLDLWVEADGTWRWKDEDELELAVAHGHHPPAEAAAIRAEGERVLAEWPFPTGWEEWRPDPAWPVPELPTGWDAT